MPSNRHSALAVIAILTASAGTTEAASSGLPEVLAGPVEISGSVHEYYLLAQCSADEARIVAESLGGRLAALDTQSERDLVLAELGAWEGTPRNCWIGLSDDGLEGDWRWSTGESRGFVAWAPGSPRKSPSRDQAYMTPNGLWIDADGSFAADDETPIHAIVEVGDVDCNLNFYPDWLDIADGESIDIDGDGVPDECQGEDCDGDGTADAVQLLNQPWLDCNDDGVPDSCAVLEDPTLDCNGNGIDDRCESPEATGFVAEYFSDASLSNRIAARIEDEVHFNTEAEPWNGAGFSDFAARWTGELVAPFTGFYTFFTVNDDGLRLFIDGEAVIDDWVAHPPTENSGGLFLTAGSHSFVLEFFDSGGGAVCELEWKPPFGDRVILPGSAMRPFLDCNRDGVLDGCQIAEDGGLDCNDNGVLDVCESPNDCDGDGIYDWCELDGNDCNTNGIPDDCEIADGVADCQLDGIPDDCQAGLRDLLAVDDGGPEYGVRAEGTYMAWLQHWQIEEPYARATAIEVDFVFVEPGRSARICLWRDPNGDGVPDDAELVHIEFINVQNPEAGERDRIELPNVELDPLGGSYFIGAMMGNVTEEEFPAALDASTAYAEASWVIGSELPLSPDDLAGEGVLEFSRLDEIGPGVWWSNWVLRLEIETAEGDCDDDGVPDACQIAEGELIDVDGNGIADACEDCDGDGIVDGCEVSCDGDCGSIWDTSCGLEADCNGDGIPDSCQSGFNGVPDCDGNGVPDACDDPDRDCDANGVLDECEIAIGAADDCNGDGVIDLCQFGGHPGYQADGDIFADNIGWTNGGGTWWAVQYEVGPGGGTIDHIDIAFGNVGPGVIAEVAVLADPNQDRDPEDMVPIVMGERPVTVQNTPGQGEPSLLRWNFDPIELGPPGTSFFVGAYVYLPSGLYPAGYDGSRFEGRSYIGRGTGIDARTSHASIGSFEFAGEWIMRAGLTGDPPLRDCNENRRLDECDILDGISFDDDLDGRPDECAPICPADFDGDGIVGGSDLGLFLLEWQQSNAAADINGDGIVDGQDFGDFLVAWGPC